MPLQSRGRRSLRSNRDAASLAWVGCAAVAWLVFGLVASAGSPFDRQRFNEFVTMRAGDGSRPVYWYCTGEMRSFPEGKTVVMLEGLGSDRLVRDARDPNLAYQLHREIFIYRDPATGQVVRELDGMPVIPIAMPYQFVTYRLAGTDLEVFVEQGSGERLAKLGPLSVAVRQAASGAVYSVPLFVQRQGAAFAHYDYFFDAAGHHRVSWIRFDDWVRPPASTRRVMHAVCSRESRFEDLPATIREYVEKEAPQFKEPPRDLEEIRRLQKGPGQAPEARPAGPEFLPTSRP